MSKFNLKLRSSYGSGIDVESSQLYYIWIHLRALEESYRNVSSKFKFLGHRREILSDLEEEGASHCHLWGILVALSPRKAGILKHSTHTKTWLIVQITEQKGLLPLADDWWHRFKVRILLSSLQISTKYLQAWNVLAFAQGLITPLAEEGETALFL